MCSSRGERFKHCKRRDPRLVRSVVGRYFVGRSPRVEDPRTGEATPRVKDVLRGEIDVFIAAWMTRPPVDA